MARHYESTEALCPYYCCEETTEVYCAGWEHGLSIRLRWRQDARRHKKTYCRADWQSCPVARAIGEAQKK